jgi:hypothetical protein
MVHTGTFAVTTINTGGDIPVGVATFQGPTPATIPTMTQWGMIIFVVLAGVGAVYFMRRKARTNN